MTDEATDGIESHAVSSSTIQSIAYEAAEKKLIVQFLNQSRYEYTAVPEHVFKLFLVAGSKGKYFDQNIRKNKGYTCVKVVSAVKKVV